ncbi:motility associated factor glycosyltransferase family protein [Clostridium hydrogeniformans]|uniref:motility associated factor glycosyltransferase family protein n=1 Tax=Clostridium hydrogeniformans TaxID=349933 RepID=UPI000481F4CB|nr:6-hydroxymethylpterin diphosphokinase MptE-like protein [Clostridium hydrogeniformans]
MHGNFIVEKSKDGNEVIKLNKDNKWIYLGSKFRANEEIDKMLQKLDDIKDTTNCIIFGLGAGAYLNKLDAKLKEKNKCLIIEPNKELIEYVKDNNELNNNIHVTSLSEDKIIFALENIIEEIDFTNFKILTAPGYEKVYKEEINYIVTLIREEFYKKAINHFTNIFFKELWTESYVKNLKSLYNSYDIEELKDKYVGIPAIIVSAGPSLEKNIDLLKCAKDKFLVLCGGRTIKPLKNIGVTADYVSVIDGSEAMYDLVKDYLDYEVPLICTDATNSKVLEEYKGKKLFYNNFLYTKDLVGKDLPIMSLGGSVAHACTAAALYFGCDPIIFIGQDLAYTNEKLHANIALDKKYENLTSKELNDIFKDKSGKVMWVEDINGLPVKTSVNLNDFRRDFEKIIEVYNDRVFINATEGGANIKGTKVKTLREVIKLYGDKEKPNISITKKLFKNKEDEDNFKKYLLDQIQIIKELKKKCNELLVVNLKYKMHFIDNKNIPNSQEVIEQLNSGEEYIMETQNKTQFMYNQIYPIVHRISVDPEFTLDKSDNTNKKYIKIYKKSQMLYKEIIKSCDKILNLFSEIKFIK